MNRIISFAQACVLAASLTSFSSALADPGAAPAAGSDTALFGKEGPSKVTSFWQWFEAHQADLTDMSGPSSAFFPEIGKHLKEIDDRLTFEIGPGADGTKEFYVSTDCNGELFPLVERIVTAAPTVKGWKIVAFRQPVPKSLLKDLSAQAQLSRTGKMDPKAPMIGVTVKDMRYTLTPDGDGVKVVIFIKDFTKEEPQSHMAMMLLQQAIGEYNICKSVSDIKYKSDTVPEAKDAKPFVEIGEDLDKMVAKVKPAS